MQGQFIVQLLYFRICPRLEGVRILRRTRLFFRTRLYEPDGHKLIFRFARDASQQLCTFRYRISLGIETAQSLGFFR